MGTNVQGDQGGGFGHTICKQSGSELPGHAENAMSVYGYTSALD